MIRIPLLLLLSVLITAISFAQQAWQPGELLILLNRDALAESVHRELVRQLPVGTVLKGMEPLGQIGRYHQLLVQGTGIDERELEQLVSRIPGVEGTSLNYRLTYNAEPNDTQYSTQWGMSDINVEPVWDFTTGGAMANGKRIAVAISDEAIETTHPDMQDNIWPGSPHQGSGSFHGTAVASVVGAVGNNGQGIAGVNWDVDIVSGAAALDLSDVIEVFEDALVLREQFNGSNGTAGALVVSITASWGAPGSGGCDGFSDPLFHDMALAGILVITSGPNEPVDLDVAPEYPSSCALAEHLVVSTIGQSGQTPYAIGSNSVHLLAPGLAIPVADELNGFQFADGNSFAIPHVAGAIALLYSVPCPGFAALVMDDPAAAREMVKNAILNNTAPVPGGNAITITGGKLDVFAAYQSLMAQCPVCDTITVHLNTPEGSDAQFNLLNGTGISIEQGTGDAIQFCVAEGCFTASVVDGASQPLGGTFTVELQGATVQSGSIVNGLLSFNFGTVVSGCTSPGASNFNASATCDDGSCCFQNAVTIVLLAQDEVASGTAQLSVEAAGNTLFNGPVTIAPVPDAGMSYGQVTLCVPSGCLSVFAQQGDVLLQESGFAFIPGGPFLEYFFLIGVATTMPVGTGNAEVCDGQDNDCDGFIDEDFLWYTDADGDGFGDASTEQVLCTPPIGSFVQSAGDCDDTNANINPGILDPCGTPDGLDNDCNGSVDDGDLIAWFPDADNDQFGADVQAVLACDQPLGHVPNNVDCDDTNSAVFPEATEICDGLDNDCDGTIDEDFLWYTDADGDGFGNDTTALPSCVPVNGAVQVGGDCDDADPTKQQAIILTVFAAEESEVGTAHYIVAQGSSVIEGDIVLAFDQVSFGEAQICLGQGCFSITIVEVDVALLEDSYVQTGSGLGAQPFLTFEGFFGSAGTPDAELCDGLDNDCDGVVDNGFLWYTDTDGDGVGVTSTEQFSCTPIPGAVQLSGDCNDADTNLTTVGAPCDDGDANTVGDIVRPDCTCLGFPQGACPAGEIEDCNGNCAPAEWVGDGFCDDGSFEHNGIPIFFNCPLFFNDGGDCGGICPNEVCNGQDDDCDGEVDEDFIWYTDADDDGYGDEATAAVNCSPQPGMVQTGGDCDDDNPAVHAGFLLTVLTEDPGDFGTAHFLIQQGSTIIEGDLDLPSEAEGVGELPVCLGDGCFSITISPNDVPLWEESYLLFPGAPDDVVAFSTIDGYQGNSSVEFCDGIDNDCDGAVDEGFDPFFADTDGDGFGDAAQPMGCTGVGVQNNDDCDDGDAAVFPGAPETCNGIDDDCDGQVDESCVLVAARVFLEGPYNAGTGIMNDGMRALGLVPTTEPYTGLGYTHVGGGSETTTPAVLAVGGNDAVVDWVVIELRNENAPAAILATRCALLQRDGDVVDVDGTSPVSIAVASGNYHVAMRHRNHLGCMSAGPVVLSPTVASVDFTITATATYGANSRKAITGTFPAQALWAGDVTFNGQVKYTGSGNDRDPVLTTVGSTTPNNTVSIYSTRDVNMNGQVKYTGSANDRDPILVNVGSTTPNNVRTQQLP